MGIAYGIDIREENGRYLKIAEEALVSTNTAGVPGTFLVDFLPFRAYNTVHLNSPHASTDASFF